MKRLKRSTGKPETQNDLERSRSGGHRDGISRLLKVSMDNNELLKYAVEHGMLDLSYVQEKARMDKRNELLKKHPYEIWNGVDGRWYTHIPSEQSGRKLRSRSTQEELEDFIVDFWKEKSNNPTIREVYEKWISDKLSRGEIAISTKNRYDRQYNESMKEFGKKKIRSIEEVDVEDFILNAIYLHQLTAKGYSNLRTLIYGIFKRAKKEKLVSFSITSVVADIDIPKKSFRKTNKSDDQLVFSESEVETIIKYFKRNNQYLDLKDYGILLLFFTGLRPGELAALKWEDIKNSVIHVCRTEIHYNDENGNSVYEVRDFPKTEAGIRKVFIPKNILHIIDRIRELNPNGEYVFERNGMRLPTYMFDGRIRLICKRNNIEVKSQNKIRKTYATTLIDANAEESLIISQMGHTDIETTKRFYYKNRKSDVQRAKAIDVIFNQPISFEKTVG